MAVKIVSALLEKESRRFAWLFFSFTLWIFGYAHMLKLGFGLSMFTDSLREHLLLCVAGFLAGWLLRDAMGNYIRDFFLSPSRSPVPWPATGFVLLPLLLLVVLHQFRYFLNDGPANIAMGFGLLSSGFLSPSARLEEMNNDAVPALETGKMEDEKMLALLRPAYSERPYSARTLEAIAQTQKRLGNGFKAAVAQSLSESTKR